jgi:hypothetical protein
MKNIKPFSILQSAKDKSNAAIPIRAGKVESLLPPLDDLKPVGKKTAPGKVHKLKKTPTHALDAVLKKAAETALDPSDPLSLYAALVNMAESKNPPAPLKGFVETEGVKYQVFEKIKFFTLGALRAQMRRQKAL